MGVTNNTTTYNVFDLFNDYEAFSASTPTTYYSFGGNNNSSLLFPTSNENPPASSLLNVPLPEHCGKHKHCQQSIQIPPFSNIIFLDDPLTPTTATFTSKSLFDATPFVDASSSISNLEHNFTTSSSSHPIKIDALNRVPLLRTPPVSQIVRTASSTATNTFANSSPQQDENAEPSAASQRKRNARKHDDEDYVEYEAEEDDTAHLADEDEQSKIVAEGIEQAVSVNIKPARKTGKYYIDFFPDKLYCSPYKYDVRSRLSNLKSAESELEQKYMEILSKNGEQFTFKLLDGETKKLLKLNSKGESALLVEKCKKQDDEEEEDSKSKKFKKEATYRLCFTVCSFHNYRRPFLIQCIDKRTGLCIFESNPFHIYARKASKDKSMDKWGNEGCVGTMKVMFFPEDEPVEEEEEGGGGEEEIKDDAKPTKSPKEHLKRKREEKQDSDEPAEEMQKQEEKVEPEPKHEPKKRRVSTDNELNILRQQVQQYSQNPGYDTNFNSLSKMIMNLGQNRQHVKSNQDNTFSELDKLLHDEHSHAQMNF